MNVKELKQLKWLETGVRWAAEHRRSPLDRATESQNAQGVFWMDLLAMCCKLGEGNLVIEGRQDRALRKFLADISVMPLSDYRKAAKSVRSQVEPELKQALAMARQAFVQLGNKSAIKAVDRIAPMRWEARADTSALSTLDSGMGNLRGASWSYPNTLY